jgi:hypothetical protein
MSDRLGLPVSPACSWTLGPLSAVGRVWAPASATGHQSLVRAGKQLLSVTLAVSRMNGPYSSSLVLRPAAWSPCRVVSDSS